MEQRFQYHPLGPQKQAFRLLRLLKGDTVDIECEIFNDFISEDNVSQYEALSYAWGSTELVECINVNGKTLRITDNLYGILQRLRPRDKDRLLWIDAICINQSDLQERGQQVQMMSLIFSSAQRVIFWLGKATAEAQLLLTYLDELHENLTDEKVADTTPTPEGLRSLFQSDPSHQIDQYCTGLQLLLNRPWFRRVWILQEVANARSAIIHVGASSVPAYLFALAPSLLGIETEPRIESVLDMMPEMHHRETAGTRRNIFDLLMKFSTSEATNQRDIFFALLGMSWEPLDHVLLRPDYTKSLSKVVHDVIRYQFQLTPKIVHKALDFLADFDSVCTTILVPLQGVGNGKAEIDSWWNTTTLNESNTCSFTPETMQSMCESSLVFSEQCQKETSGPRCCADLVELQSQLKKTEDRPDELPNKLKKVYGRFMDDSRPWDAYRETYLDALRFVDYKSQKKNVRFVIVKRPAEALRLAGGYHCKRLFAMIAEGIVDDKQGLLNSTLLEAFYAKHEGLITLSLTAGADPKFRVDSKYDLLTEALHDGEPTIVKAVVDGGVDVNREQEEHNNPLILAICYKRPEVVKILVEAGAHFNHDSTPFATALWHASSLGHTAIVRILLDAGADVSAGNDYYGSALEGIFGTLSPSYPEIEIPMIELLIERGANINCRDAYGRTPLMIWIQKAKNKAQIETLKELINLGADVSLHDHFGSTASDYLKVHETHQELLNEIRDNPQSPISWNSSQLRPHITKQCVYLSESKDCDYLQAIHFKALSHFLALIGDMNNASIAIWHHDQSGGDSELDWCRWCDAKFEYPSSDWTVYWMCQICTDLRYHLACFSEKRSGAFGCVHKSKQIVVSSPQSTNFDTESWLLEVARKYAGEEDSSMDSVE